jgi:DnaJ-class molecular chaperone
VYRANIDLLTALAGGQFTIKHLDDRVLLVTIIPGEIIKPGKFANPFTQMVTYNNNNDVTKY